MQTGCQVLKIGTFLWFLMAGFELMAQKDSSTASIQQFALTATNFEAQQMFDSAVYYHYKVAGLYYQNDQLYEYINSFNNIADLFIKQGKYDEAVKWLDSAYHKPVSSFRNEDERLALLEWHLFKAYANEQLGDLVSARTIYESAKLKLVNNGNYEDFYVGKFLYQPLGNICARLGDHKEAIKLLKRFKEISVRYGDNNAAAQAANDLSIIYRALNQRNLAIEEYRSVLELPQLGKSTQGLMKVNLAAAYYEDKKLRPAMINANEAVEIFERIINNGDTTSQNRDNLSRAYHLSGVIYTGRGQFGVAVRYFQQSLKMAILASETTKNPQIAKIYNGMGELFLKQNQPEQSLRYFHEALKAVVPDFDESDPEINPETSQLYSENSIFEAIDGKFRAFKLWYSQSSEPRYLNLALANHQLTSAVEKMLTTNFRREFSMLLLLAKSRLRSEQALEIVYQLYEIDKEAIYMEEALQIMENHKAMRLLESVKHLKIKDFAHIPNWLLSKELQLKSMKSDYQKQLSTHKLLSNKDSSLMAQMQDKIHRADNDLHIIEERLKEEFPNYYKLKHAYTTSASTGDLTKLAADKNSSLITYFVGEKAIYSLLIDSNSARFVRIEKEASFEDRVWKLIDLAHGKDIETQSPRDLGKLAGFVYKKLIGPLKIDKKTENLVIIPDGVLEYLSFDILMSEKEINNLNYRKLPYLIKSHALSYAFSTNVLLQNQGYQAQPNEKQAFLGIAPIYRESSRFAYLPLSKSEVESIRDRLDGEVLLAQEATKAKFKSMGPDYRILHISSHTGTHDSLPLYSWIGFSDISSQNGDHYKLYLSDLYGMDLGAELVVLSIHGTESSAFSGGESLMNLARSFAYAGCQSVVTTLWPVHDSTMVKIMENFYRFLQKGQNKAEALRNAKLAYVNSDADNALYAHPFYWTATMLVGNTDPVYEKNNYTIFMWILIPFLILAVVVLIYVKKK